MFSSGSGNQAILAPLGAVQMPRSSWLMVSYRWNTIPRAASPSTVD